MMKNMSFAILIAVNCSEDSLRLFNRYGTAGDGGMLQVCKSNVWRAVCDHQFRCKLEGKAACRQMGYQGGRLSKCMVALLKEVCQ